MKKDMRETDGSQTDRMIREGRAGAMAGCEVMYDKDLPSQVARNAPGVNVQLLTA